MDYTKLAASIDYAALEKKPTQLAVTQPPSAKREPGENKGKVVVFIRLCSYTEPMMSRAIAPSISTWNNERQILANCSWASVFGNRLDGDGGDGAFGLVEVGVAGGQ